MLKEVSKVISSCTRNLNGNVRAPNVSSSSGSYKAICIEYNSFTHNGSTMNHIGIQMNKFPWFIICFLCRNKYRNYQNTEQHCISSHCFNFFCFYYFFRTYTACKYSVLCSSCVRNIFAIFCIIYALTKIIIIIYSFLSISCNYM